PPPPAGAAAVSCHPRRPPPHPPPPPARPGGSASTSPAACRCPADRSWRAARGGSPQCSKNPPRCCRCPARCANGAARTRRVQPHNSCARLPPARARNGLWPWRCTPAPPRCHLLSRCSDLASAPRRSAPVSSSSLSFRRPCTARPLFPYACLGLLQVHSFASSFRQIELRELSFNLRGANQEQPS